MKTITSAENPLVKGWRALQRAEGRREQGLFLAEGPHLVEEALRAGATLRQVLVRQDDAERYAALLTACEAVGAELIALPERLIAAVADARTPQGILATVEQRPLALTQANLTGGRLAVLLERVQDPGNLGTILRTALAVGADYAVLCAGTADPWGQKVVRASQGAVLHLPLVLEEDAVAAVAALNAAGWHTACGHLGGTDFFARQPHARTALVIGNEGAGVSPAVAALCVGRYALPMPGPAESLNAAVAAGVMLYDLWREQSAR